MPLGGWLQAQRDCTAVSSIKRGATAGDPHLAPGATYRVLGKNKAVATHYLIRLEGERPAERWVEMECGLLVDTPSSRPQPKHAPTDNSGSEPSPGTIAGPAGVFILAASWQQAYCEIRPYAAECREGTTRAQGDLQFSLHGLWPQPRDAVYCGVSDVQRDLSERGPWRRLPMLDLTDETRERLGRAMPGTLSYLHRHEWIKHGSCYGTGEDRYFRHALALLERLNASSVRELFTANVGRHLSSRRIRERFDQAFGRGAGERVRVSCEGGMIMELHLNLAGRISEHGSLAELIRAAKRRSVGCRGGRVDPAGVGN